MNIKSITPMVLVFNESPNIERALASLSWAECILVVDSFSQDETLEICRRFRNTEIVQREFDHFAEQCNFGLEHITTDWVLSIDADYICPPSMAAELVALEESYDGYRARFLYSVFGRTLRACLYPPRTVLYRREKAEYLRDGHAHRVRIEGAVGQLQSAITHDDRKSLARWLKSQVGYAEMEAQNLVRTPSRSLSWKDRLRKKIVFAPGLVLLYCLFVKGLIFDGWSGILYAFQRTYAELLLSVTLLDQKLRRTDSGE